LYDLVIVGGGLGGLSAAHFFREQRGDGKVVDVMVKDGLWDVYNDFHMGLAAELCATEKDIPREEQDAFAIESYKRAIEATKNGYFKNEIVPVEVPGRKGQVTVVDEDEEPKRVKFEKIPSLRPAFKKDGTVTAANASSINDGASALVLMSASKAAELGLDTVFFQSDREGDLVAAVNTYADRVQAVLTNPGAFTHTSVALRDALSGLEVPVAEVHISAISDREAFRQRSLIRPIADFYVEGEGIAGYGRAIEMLARALRS
jgi:3-dehydroquinate dehydratase